MHWEVCGHELEIMQLEEENHALEQQLEVLLNVKAQKQGNATILYRIN